jgi:hypothetical protein
MWNFQGKLFSGSIIDFCPSKFNCAIFIPDLFWEGWRGEEEGF